MTAVVVGGGGGGVVQPRLQPQWVPDQEVRARWSAPPPAADAVSMTHAKPAPNEKGLRAIQSVIRQCQKYDYTRIDLSDCDLTESSTLEIETWTKSGRTVATDKLLPTAVSIDSKSKSSGGGGGGGGGGSGGSSGGSSVSSGVNMIKILAAFLNANRHISEVDLSVNQIGKPGLIVLLKVVERTAAIIKFDIRGNRQSIGTELFQRTQKAIIRNHNIQQRWRVNWTRLAPLIAFTRANYGHTLITSIDQLIPCTYAQVN